jgi:hypothetical protein
VCDDPGHPIVCRLYGTGVPLVPRETPRTAVESPRIRLRFGGWGVLRLNRWPHRRAPHEPSAGNAVHVLWTMPTLPS